MPKKYEVTLIDSKYLPSMPGQVSSFSVPLPEEFDSLEEANEFAEKARQRKPSTLCSVREVGAE
jgi:hypothetical protein